MQSKRAGIEETSGSHTYTLKAKYPIHDISHAVLPSLMILLAPKLSVGLFDYLTTSNKDYCTSPQVNLVMSSQYQLLVSS